MGTVLERAHANGISVRPTFYTEDDDSDLLHYHETSYLTFILQGGSLARVKTDEFECFPGTLTFYHAGEPHQCLHKAAHTRCINFEVEERFYLENDISETVLNESIKRNPNVKFAMLQIYNELLAKDEFSECSIEMVLLSLLESKDFLESPPSWILKIDELLNDKWNEELNLEDLARVAGVHSITVSKFFSKYFSCTFGEYRRRLKIEKSLSMIKNSDFSLTDVAHQCGFYDQSHFTRTFKKLTGLLPRHYESL